MLSIVEGGSALDELLKPRKLVGEAVSRGCGVEAELMCPGLELVGSTDPMMTDPCYDVSLE